MAYYKIDDLLECISNMKKDGFDYIDLSVIEAIDDNDTESLSIEAISPTLENEEEMIDSVAIPTEYFHE